MKRFLKVFTAMLALSLALCAGAAASDFDTVAQELSAIGMFRGTGGSFELDRAPLRAEAAIMLVRLYGAEEQANASYADGTTAHPFTDVPSWCAPHVAWLYEQGLTKGIGNNAFGSTDTCNAQSYATFLLRALGYQDGVDFEYKDALTFAQDKGFYEPTYFSGEFLRDDLAALTYQALATDVKDGSGYLLSELVSSGAIDAGAARPMTEKIELFRQMANAASADLSSAVDAAILTNMDITMTAGGITIPQSTSTSDHIAVKMTGGDLQLAYTSVSESSGTTTSTGMWMKDNWVYLSTKSGPLTMKYKYPVADSELSPEDLDVANIGGVSTNGLAVVESITAKKSGGDTVYTLVIREGLGSVLGLGDSIPYEDAQISSLKYGRITATYTVSASGTLKKSTLIFSAAADMKIPDEETGAAIPVSAAYDYTVYTTINATGGDVEITYPDLSEFVEMAPSLLG